MNTKPSYVGKVRDVYDLGDRLVLVATDRISAFDSVFAETIPDKGKILNRISNLWFAHFSRIPNHILETDLSKFPEPFRSEPSLSGRSVLVKKCKRIDFECVVRGYLSGSGYSEYKEKGTLADKTLPSGIPESGKLPEPAFTPAVKNDDGHDENISEAEMEKRIGSELFRQLKALSISIYTEASEMLEKAGIILCDTKFEFGILDGEVLLIDELLTPDSSRYWSKESYEPGKTPPSLDKQILRNYLLQTGWDKNPPPPHLPETLIQEIRNKYLEIQELIETCLSQK